jgi:uncharacterized protein YneF (UPF0154 family)
MEFLIYIFVGLFFILGILSLYFCALKIFTKILEKFPTVNKQHIQETSMIEEKIEHFTQTYDEKLSSLDELFKRSIDYKKSDTYKEALAFVIKLRNVAPFNAWLLGGQNSDITHVATANEWALKFDRSIKPKARAYIILKQFGPVDFVYDVADTDGAELPKDLQAHFRAEGYLNTDFVANILHCCEKKGIKVEFDNTLRQRQAGWASHTALNGQKKIVINNEHSKEVQFSTLCHELAHLMLGHLGEFRDCQCKDRSHMWDETMEVEAESVSWLVCQRLGIETDADKYLNQYLEKKNGCLENISVDNILMTAGRIEKMALKKECNIKKLKAKSNR